MVYMAHGILQARIVEWVAFPFSRRCSQPRDWTQVSHTAGRFFISWEGNGNPLQCSCLENPRDGGAWWAAVYGVAQSRTWLKWLSSSSNSRRSYRSSQKHLTSASLGIILDYRDVECKRIEIILSFLRFHPSMAFQTLLLTVRTTPFLLGILVHNSRNNDYLN